MTDAPNRPATPVAETRRSRGAGISAVWLVPMLAIVIALAIAWQSYRDRGVLIAVAFPDASGVTIGQTTLRFREVTVGVVEDVAFNADLTQVNVYIRVNNDIAPYLDQDASFWIVQPEVTTRGVQGLNTILSGTYVQGTWDNQPGIARTAFAGDERAPIIPPGVNGTAIVLRAKDSSRLGSGAPILYRGIEVGEVSQPRLSPDGSEVRVDAFVLAPYDRQLSTATRFWDASGVSATIGTGGVDLRIGSIASIIEGGVNFDTLISGGDPIPQGYVYSIFDDEDAALVSTYETVEQRSVTVSALFPTAVPGLASGASVQFQGVRVGTVTNITGFIRPDNPTRQVQLLAVMNLQAAKMGLADGGNDLDSIDFIDGLVLEGLRAKLVSTSILGGELAIELVDDPEAAAGQGLEIGVASNPLIPTLDADIQGLTASAESVLERINDLPVEELLAAATSLLENVNRIAADGATRAIPAEALALLAEGRGLARDSRSILASPQVAGVLADVEAVTGDLRQVTADIAERALAVAVADALGAATEAARNLAAGTADLDALTGSAQVVLDGVAGLVGDPATRALPVLARDTLAGARALAAAPEIATILADTAAATASLRALVAPYDGTALAETVNRTLAAIDVTAANVAAGTADLEALTGSAQVVLDGAAGLVGDPATRAIPAEALALLAEGRGLARDSRSILASPQVAGVLADVEAITGDLRQVTADIAERALAVAVADALAAATEAARNLAAGTATLDALTGSAQVVLDGVAGLVGDPATRALPVLARDTLAGARALATAPELATILTDTAAATASLRALVAPYDGTALAETVNRTLAAIDVTAANVAAGTADLDALRAQIVGILTAADALVGSADTQALPSAARGLLEDGLGLVNAPEVRAILTEAAAVTADIGAITADLRQRDAAASLTTALDAAAAAARSVAAGAANLPAISASAERVLAQAETLSQGLTDLTAKANDLALDELVNAATDLARTADAFLSSDEAGDVPVVLSNTLEELRLTIETIRTGGTLDNLNTTLRSTATAADGIAAAATELPALVARLQDVATQAGSLLGTYGADSRVNTELYAALRAVTRAAADVSSLSRTIERNPNSLLLGR